MQVNAVNNYNNNAPKAQFGSLTGFGKGLLNKVSSKFIADPPANQMLVLPLANGDHILVFDVYESSQQPGNTAKQSYPVAPTNNSTGFSITA